MDSALARVWIPAAAGNYTPRRPGKVQEITVHHCAGNIGVEQLGRMWQGGGGVSSHYGINGADVGQYVAEADVAHCNGDWAANCRAVTIECANSGGAPEWPVSDETLETLAALAADIAQRQGLGRLEAGKNLTWHSMYKATECPGPYLRARMGAVAARANDILTQKEGASGLMRFFEVFGAVNCQCFTAPNVDAVDESVWASGRMPAAAYPLMADAGTDAGGLHWVRVYAAGGVRYAVVLADRSRLVDLSAGDAVAAVLAQAPKAAGTPPRAQKELEAAAAALEAARQEQQGLLACAQTAAAALEELRGKYAQAQELLLEGARRAAAAQKELAG